MTAEAAHDIRCSPDRRPAARPELLDLLAAAETLLAATGQAVALCPNYGTETLT